MTGYSNGDEVYEGLSRPELSGHCADLPMNPHWDRWRLPNFTDFTDFSDFPTFRETLQYGTHLPTKVRDLPITHPKTTIRPDSSIMFVEVSVWEVSHSVWIFRETDIIENPKAILRPSIETPKPFWDRPLRPRFENVTHTFVERQRTIRSRSAGLCETPRDPTIRHTPSYWRSQSLYNLLTLPDARQFHNVCGSFSMRSST